MLDRLFKSRCPISNVLANRSMTTAAMTHKFEVTEHQWTDVETLIKLLKPLQIMTTVFFEKNIVRVQWQIASFLDPRFLEHETVKSREEIRTRVKNLINEMAEINCDVQFETPVTKHHGALEFLFCDETLATEYPLNVALARKYLGIPTTSVSSERCFSTSRNIATAKRSCLAPKTVNMLIFLYQNKQLL
ncbi:unnamed protein product [Macrosiphum euphorbiae]|uniref:HAT C-terminal dimerisation domain-containing protein n=1 Tax=Macrosiphum euphorbiae TaxID=13131 RepID=A0AAV0WQ55_9HEMI|nr:unnamed protein product [Macrosiphum euphorbiae]